MSTTGTRRTHRKRVSALRLSSDTTSTLPEYITVGGWHREDDLPSDKPPDYPDSAEEADEDTDEDSHPSSVYVPPSNLSPRRIRRFTSHRRRSPQSSNSPYLDSLLARSVHALEMSNTLLQSSMSTQASLSNIFASDSPSDKNLETSARGLSMRIQGGRDVHATWADELEEIRIGVEGLFEGESSGSRINGHVRSTTETSISSSLPISSPSQLYQQRRRPSLLDLHSTSEYRPPQLRLSHQDRSNLISPPPRAITQYVASTSDGDLINLPSTLGLRAPPSSYRPADWRPETSQINLHATLSSPQLTDRPLEPSTPAYNMLSSFVHRPPPPLPPEPGSTTPSSSFSSSLPSFLVRNSRNPSTSAERRNTRERPSPSRVTHRSPETSIDRSSPSLTPKQILCSLPDRPMTPPTEESSSSDGCPAKRTVLSLRRILDEQPAPSPPAPPERPHPPAFLLPRTPAPVAEAGTSTATASVSRLFTKAKHTSSTRPQSPPRQSAMKQLSPSPAMSPSPSPTVLSIPDLFGAGVVRALGGSTPSSGRSTPKRISFAELPESYAGSKPAGSSSKFRDKKSRRGKKVHEKRKDKEGVGVGEGGWWTSWLVGAVGPSTMRYEDRIEDRLNRSWGGRMAGTGFGSGLDEWAV